MRPIRLIPPLLAAALCSTSIHAAAEEAVSIPRFVEETASAGIDTVYDGEWEFMVGGGTAVFDCDGDRRADVLVAGGAGASSLYRNASEIGGALRFERRESGLEVSAVSGAYPLDVDGDGIQDVLLLRVGENLVLRGLGGCRFERANEAWGFDGGDAWSPAFAATWERGMVWPTLAVGNYIDRKEEAFPWGSCTANWLHRPVDTAARAFARPLPLAPSYCALSILFTDWNRSGTPDLRVSNDREYYKGGQEQLWRVAPGEAPALYGPPEGWKPLRIWGMGIASRDLDRDGYPEYFLTSMADNKLQALSNPGAPGGPLPDFADIAFARGVTAHRPYVGETVKPSTAWHAQFEDVNNDGRADLFIVKGNVAKMPDFAEEDPNNLLLQREDGTFLEAGDKAGVASIAIGRGGALADFNLDGRLDMLVANRWSTAQVWRNVDAGGGGWLQLELRQPGANRDAIGAWIEVRTGERVQRREITVGGGHASGQAGWRHFGLGEATSAEVRVLWPDGEAGDWQRLDAGRFYLVERGLPAVAWTPG